MATRRFGVPPSGGPAATTQVAASQAGLASHGDRVNAELRTGKRLLFARLNRGIIYFDHGHDYGHFWVVKTVSKAKLKAKMLAYFREVEATGEPLIVTDHGRAVLEVRPATPRNKTKTLVKELRALAKSAAKIDENEMLKPLPLEDWEAEGKNDRNAW